MAIATGAAASGVAVGSQALASSRPRVAAPQSVAISRSGRVTISGFPGSVTVAKSTLADVEKTWGASHVYKDGSYRSVNYSCPTAYTCKVFVLFRDDRIGTIKVTSNRQTRVFGTLVRTGETAAAADAALGRPAYVFCEGAGNWLAKGTERLWVNVTDKGGKDLSPQSWRATGGRVANGINITSRTLFPGTDGIGGCADGL